MTFAEFAGAATIIVVALAAAVARLGFECWALRRDNLRLEAQQLHLEDAVADARSDADYWQGCWSNQTGKAHALRGALAFRTREVRELRAERDHLAVAVESQKALALLFIRYANTTFAFPSLDAHLAGRAPDLMEFQANDERSIFDELVADWDHETLPEVASRG